MAVYIRRRCEGHRLMSEPAIYELLDHGVRRFRHHINVWLQDMGLRDAITVTHDGERVLVIGASEFNPAPFSRMDTAKIDPATAALHSDRMVQGLTLNVLAILYKGTSRERYFSLHLN